MGVDPGEHRAFERMYAAHHQLVLRYCYRRLGDLEYARELTQETFVVAWRRRRDAPEPAAPWLYGIARRVLADHWRTRRARPVTVPVAESTDAGAEDGGFDAVSLAQDLRQAFIRLSEPDREILRLVTWEELDLAAVAQVLGCSRTAAGVRLFRARRRLHQLMDTPPPVRVRPVPTSVRGGAL